MTKHRIQANRCRYKIQYRFLGFWCDYFSSPSLGIVQTYSTLTAAQDKLSELDPPKPSPKPKWRTIE